MDKIRRNGNYIKEKETEILNNIKDYRVWINYRKYFD